MKHSFTASETTMLFLPMKLKLIVLLSAICTYSTATHHHLNTNTIDVHHFVPHLIHEKVEAVKSVFPIPPPLPKIPPFIVKDHVHHKLTHHHPHHTKVVLPIPIFPPPLFPKVHLDGPHILPPPSVVPHVLKPLLKVPLPLPHPKFLKPLPIPIPLPVPVVHPVAPVVEPIIPIIKDHHHIHVHELIK